METVDLTARVAAAIGTVPPPFEREGGERERLERELVEELRTLRRELAELRATTALLNDEVARLRLAGAPRRIVPFAVAEGRGRLS